MRLFLICLALLLPLTAQADRLALVMANSEYERAAKLPQTAADAQAMAEKLRTLGFELVGDKAHINKTRDEMLDLADALGERAKAGDEVVIYFSGHGIGGEQTNFLLPANDERIKIQQDVEDRAVDVARIVARLPVAETGANVLILDACRDNPLPSGAKSSGTAKGLVNASVTDGSNMVYLYAAQPGKRAYVSSGGRSFFTDALLEALDEPGQNLQDVVRSVRERVKADVRPLGLEQLPWIEGVTPQPFIFRPFSEGEIAADTSALPARAPARTFDLIVESFDASDPQLAALGRQIEQAFSNYFTESGLSVGYAPILAGDATSEFQINGSLSLQGPEASFSLLLSQSGAVLEQVDISAPLQEFQRGYAALPTAMTHFFDRKRGDLAVEIPKQKLTRSEHAWWAFERARAAAADSKIETAIDLLDRAVAIDARFSSALWAKGDLLFSDGQDGQAFIDQAQQLNPDTIKLSIASDVATPLQALFLSSQSQESVMLPSGIELIEVEAPEYRAAASAWIVDPALAEIEVVSAIMPRGETVKEIRERTGATLVINGGYFEKDRNDRLTPSGLLIVDGNPFKEKTDKGSGVFIETENGPLVQYARKPMPDDTVSALQSGPIAVEADGSMGIWSDDGKRANRSLVCPLADGRFAFIIIQGDLTLYEVSRYLAASEPGGLVECYSALNLDGGPTTQLSYADGEFEREILGGWTTQSAIIVTAAAP